MNEQIRYAQFMDRLAKDKQRGVVIYLETPEQVAQRDALADKLERHREEIRRRDGTKKMASVYTVDREVVCPFCDAPVGSPCVVRYQFHRGWWLWRREETVEIETSSHFGRIGAYRKQQGLAP